MSEREKIIWGGELLFLAVYESTASFSLLKMEMGRLFSCGKAQK